jgi:hypothetical protein
MSIEQNETLLQVFLHHKEGNHSYAASPVYSHFHHLMHILAAASPKVTLLGREDFALTVAETQAFTRQLNITFRQHWEKPWVDRSPKHTHITIYYEGSTRKLWLQYDEDADLLWMYRLQGWMHETLAANDVLHFTTRLDLDTPTNRILIALKEDESPATLKQILVRYHQRFATPFIAEPEPILEQLKLLGCLKQHQDTYFITPKGRLPH